MTQQQTIPVFDTPQQLRTAVELEMQMYGLGAEQHLAVIKAVEA